MTKKFITIVPTHIFMISFNIFYDDWLYIYDYLCY